MNETFSSSHTEDLNFILNNKLRNFAYEIRNKEIKNKKIEEYIQDIYELLVMFLGEPPKKFNWEYYSIKKEKKKYNIVKELTPVIYYKKYTSFNVNDMVCLVNAPCKSKPFYNIFDLKHFGNVLGGHNSNFINIPIEDMIITAKKSLDNNQAIWFGCDVDKYLDEKEGLLNKE